MSADEEAVRRALHDLPEVAPPEGFYEALIRRRRRRAWTLVGVGLVAAGVVGAIVVAHATGVAGHPSPALAELVGQHEELVQADEHTVVFSVPAPFQAPAELGPMERGFVMRHDDDGIQILYTHEGRVVSVFEQAGDLDESALSDDLTPMPVDGAEAWMAHEGDTIAVVVPRHTIVYVVIGDATPDELIAVAEDLPDGRPMSMTRRIGDAMDDLVRAFGLG